MHVDSVRGLKDMLHACTLQPITVTAQCSVRHKDEVLPGAVAGNSTGGGCSPGVVGAMRRAEPKPRDRQHRRAEPLLSSGKSASRSSRRFIYAGMHVFFSSLILISRGVTLIEVPIQSSARAVARWHAVVCSFQGVLGSIPPKPFIFLPNSFVVCILLLC